MADTQTTSSKTTHSPRSQSTSVRPELDRIASSARPWWAETPDVAAKCLSFAFAPVRYLAALADAAVSIVFLAIIAVVAAWWNGYISDDTVAYYLGQVGDRGLAVLQASGVL